MNTKNNRRKQASVERIQQAFMLFLRQQELSQISVSDICKEAGINRSTFYANYTDIYDLANKLCQELENEVAHLLVLESGWQQSSQEFLKLFRHIRENQQLYTVFFKLGYENRERTWYDARDLQGMPDQAVIHYHVAFFASGFNAIVKLWLRGGCKETPEQMCQVLLDEYRGRFELPTGPCPEANG